MLYLYLDESGDLGFDFVNKKPSKFFTVTVMALRTVESNKKLEKAVQITLRRKFGKNLSAELKGSACPLNIKKYFYTFVKDIDFSIYSITLNKIRLYENLRKDKERVYNYVVRLVLDQIPLNTTNVKLDIIIDKSKTKKTIFEFNQYIIRQVKSKINPLIPLNIYHFDSKNNYGLQSVDLFCWGIFRKYERKDSEWFNIFNSKVKYDTLYLP